MRRTVSFYTLGCKVNQYDSAALLKAMEKVGFVSSKGRGGGDVVVINTCTVTHAADRQDRQLIRKLRKEHPQALMVVTGCLAEVDAEGLRRMPEVDLVVRNRQKAELPRLVVAALEGGERKGEGSLRSLGSDLWETPLEGLPGHTRAFLKVQDGCEARCAYCIVPRARGPSRSRPVSSVVEELLRMEESGVQEVVLTGIRLGLYGRDLSPPVPLWSLLDEILHVSHIPRVRLSSIEPLELDKALLERMADSERLCSHLHVPLQSGDEEILRRMNRPYSPAQYRKVVQDACSLVPDLTLGTDVIVGFPGEGREHFEGTVRFLEEIPFTYFHVFPFSPRVGTPADRLPGRVNPSEVKARSRVLRDLSQRKRREAMASYVGRTLRVLLERPWRGGGPWMEGLTDNYLRVRVKAPGEWRNRLVEVIMERVEEDHLVGRIEKGSPRGMVSTGLRAD
jgi:threonylcarbamoyladenosine tRNA methylthiotransferase MtaB